MATENDAYSIDDATDAFLDRWKDAEKPSEKKEEEDTEVDAPKEAKASKDATDSQADEQTEDDTEDESDEAQEEAQDEDESEDTEEESDEDGSDEETKEPKALGDDDEVEITIDKEKRKVPVKELKRLYGQEAALTKKSQQVAAQRKEVEAQGTKQAAVLDQLFQRAQAKWEPYAKVDMLLASKELDTESFAALRAEAQAAYDEFTFVSVEANKFMQDAQARQAEHTKVKAQEATKVLKETIPNWSNDLYDKIRTYAVDNGFDSDAIARVTDPVAILMMHKARLYDEGKKIKLKPKAKAPTKVLKSSNTNAQDLVSDKGTKAMKQLKSTGSIDDAVEAMMARWA